jgi:hypothetical protein
VINHVVGIGGNGEGERRNGDLLSNFLELGQLGRQVGKEPLEADSGIKRVQNSGMVRMKLIGEDRSAAGNMKPGFKIVPYLNGFAPRNVIREVSGVEVTEHRSDGDDQFRTFNLFKDFRVTEGPDVYLETTTEYLVEVTSQSATYATISRIVLINSGLSHGRGVDRELGLVQELSQLLLNTVTDCASVDEDDDIGASLLDQLVNTLDDRSLGVRVVLRWLPIERGAQPRGGDLLVRHISGKGEIHRSSLWKSQWAASLDDTS